jgi:hypothetical protein
MVVEALSNKDISYTLGAYQKYLLIMYTEDKKKHIPPQV